MGRRKLQRFEELDRFPNSFYNPVHMKGKWHTDFFRNQNPIVLELGCGRGEYTVGLGRAYPGKNFIGVDLKGARLWRGAKTGIEEQMTNIGFIRSQIDHIGAYFAEGEVDEIWITFPDPQVELSREKKRLTHMNFLNIYRHFLKPGGLIHLKTDSKDLYEYTLEVINDNKLPLIKYNNDVYNWAELFPDLEIKTTYERKYLALSKNIHYIRFSL